MRNWTIRISNMCKKEEERKWSQDWNLKQLEKSKWLKLKTESHMELRGKQVWFDWKS